jgi:hypothetical protein
VGSLIHRYIYIYIIKKITEQHNSYIFYYLRVYSAHETYLIKYMKLRFSAISKFFMPTCHRFTSSQPDIRVYSYQIGVLLGIWQYR